MSTEGYTILKTRMIRINDEITRVVADIIRSEMADPRIGVVSVMKAETTADLKYCKVYVSMLGARKQQADAMAALNKAAGFIRHRIAEIINLRSTPELTFVYDDSIEHGIRMTKLIEEVNRGTNT
jgi:ribosome-binding factor A